MATELPSPPFVEVPGIHNFRDISDGSHVKTGLVFRSADPTKATEDGLKKMSSDLGIKKIFDLRSHQEIQRDGPEWAGVEVNASDPFEAVGMQREWVPVFATQDYGPEQVAVRYKHYTSGHPDGFVTAYRDILKAGPSAYGKIFRHLAQPEPTPCLVHCTAGKDRTGVLVALLFLLVDVPKEAISQEYSLTDQGLAPLKPLFIERLLKNPALEGNRDGVLNMVSSKKENMDGTIDMILKEHKSAEEYMRTQCKLSDEEIEQLRKNLRKA
ncbi:unnamed protein product [Zymoseptoria tritici ST99CH_1E4]|uniref:Tyrosine specific protein phosphatases domain-containing protein n=1 Tax=Zymoseptoria tritici ST99CH_1E4 TaxID=1276532 RepID=A0A2H1G574_ZYMTR|nr:unnamed protein product [Zymoseptoria tritici ST99CH_1E4]